MMPDFTLREKTLGQALLKAYDMNWGFMHKFYDCKDESLMIAKPKYSSWLDNTAYRFTRWCDLLYGNIANFVNVTTFERGEEPEWRSLNRFIRANASKYDGCKNRLGKLIDFKSLDELDILLTLAGKNTPSDQ